MLTYSYYLLTFKVIEMKKFNIERTFIRKNARLNNLVFKHVAANGFTKSHYVLVNKFTGVVCKVFSKFKAAFFFTMSNGMRVLNPLARRIVTPGDLHVANKMAILTWLKFNQSIMVENGDKYYYQSNGDKVFIDAFTIPNKDMLCKS